MVENNDKYALAKGRFYCEYCGEMKPVSEKIETFVCLLKLQVLVRVECCTCCFKRIKRESVR